MNIRLAHVLVDDYVSQVMDIGMSNQLCEPTLWNMGLDRPNLRRCGIATMVSCNVYATSLDLRLSYVLGMCSDLLRSYQTLLRNWVVINVAFGFVMKHALRHGQSRWDLPLSEKREISLGPSSDRIRKCMAMLVKVKELTE